jgi:squalene-hopene/tetraprenyl-beta-curcumene cyclase
MRNRILAVTMVAAALPVFCSDWNARLAADYLDSREKEWSAWQAAAAPGGTCFSCHTNMTYLLARPFLRAALKEGGPTRFESALLDGLRARADKREAKEIFAAFTKEPIASQALGVEAIFATLFLTLADSGKPGMSAATHLAFDRMWSLQIQEGKTAGAWEWFSLDLDLWETADSPYYGAALAAVAAGSAPSAYREQPEVGPRVRALTNYLLRERENQPLHNRLMLLWAAAKLPDVLPAVSRRALMEEIRHKQGTDGGWSIESLGPWKQRPSAPPSEGSNSYATAFAAYALERGGVPASDSQLKRALEWLRAHQDRESGFWEANSMNKRFEPGSMQVLFMRDAATAFAALALVEAGTGRK